MAIDLQFDQEESNRDRLRRETTLVSKKGNRAQADFDRLKWRKPMPERSGFGSNGARMRFPMA
jgi:hypothetical protein